LYLRCRDEEPWLAFAGNDRSFTMSTSRLHLIVSLVLLGGFTTVGCATAEENNDGGSGAGAGAPGTGAGEEGGAPGNGGAPSTNSGDGGMASMTTSDMMTTNGPGTTVVVDGAGGSAGTGMCEQFSCLAMCIEEEGFGQCVNGECVCGEGFPTGGFPTGGGFGGGFPSGGFGGGIPSGGFGGMEP
jgi:hypothetical protein